MKQSLRKVSLVAVLAIILFGFLTVFSVNAGSEDGEPFQAIWENIVQLDERVTNIELAHLPQSGPGSDGLSVAIINGTLLNPGDSKTHTLYDLSNHDSSYLELLAVVHDVNSNTNRLYHHGEYGWYREWYNPPTKQVLGTPINAGTGSYTINTVASGNSIQVVVKYTGSYSTNTNYQIIAKWLV